VKVSSKACNALAATTTSHAPAIITYMHPPSVPILAKEHVSTAAAAAADVCINAVMLLQLQLLKMLLPCCCCPAAAGVLV
ncbi:hypothetical protein, partial [Microbacterium aurantiacum]|uniref:hypothetical protein n=1 Tax=Microbacterium aurantiacum TaxID=162393 RepID=UPI0040351980